MKTVIRGRDWEASADSSYIDIFSNSGSQIFRVEEVGFTDISDARIFLVKNMCDDYDTLIHKLNHMWKSCLESQPS